VLPLCTHKIKKSLAVAESSEFGDTFKDKKPLA
jgi:hypothetical protein